MRTGARGGLAHGLLFLAALVVAFVAGRRAGLWRADDAVRPTACRASAGRPAAPRDAPAGGPTALAPRPGGAAGRMQELASAVRAMRADDEFRAGLTSILDQSDKFQRQRHLALLFRAWLDVHPKAALAEVRRVVELRYDHGRVAAAFADWASAQPAAGAALLAEVFDGNERKPAAEPPYLDGLDSPDYLLSVAAGLGQTDPMEAGDVVARLRPGVFRKNAMEVVAQACPSDRLGAMREWAAAIAEPVFRREALATVVDRSARIGDPREAAAWALTLPEGEDQLVAARAIATQWSDGHARDAFAWASGLPGRAVRVAAVEAAMPHLVLVDPGAAADWLNRHEASPDLDGCVAAYARGLAPANPSAALESLAGITDVARREALFLPFARAWLRRDPVAARRLLEAATDIPARWRAAALGITHGNVEDSGR